MVSRSDALLAALGPLKFLPEDEAIARLLADPPYEDRLAGEIEDCAARIVEAVRSDREHRNLVDRFMAEYGLTNTEGVALMCLAESLLRVPDRATADALIADKISAAEWAAHLGRADDWLVNASTWGLLLTGRVTGIDRSVASDPLEWLMQLVNRVGEPVIHSAMRGAMHIMGNAFVLGETIDAALGRRQGGLRHSYDMLGEGARDAVSAARYADAYAHAIERIPVDEALPMTARDSISIKLSALHPRYEAAQRSRVLSELVPRVVELCMLARQRGLALTVDAEEADRLMLSLEVFARVMRAPALTGWGGLGLALQAYGKRAPAAIDWLAALAQEAGCVVPVRLVKGAYWDAEIKHAQEGGFSGFPVYTRKAATDLAYLCCARQLLARPGLLYAQFATHNAHTVAAIMAMAPQREAAFEFQRLHGMGEALYHAAPAQYGSFPAVRVYAPVGAHEDLLAYLVRRLLENGANSSFVNRLFDSAQPAKRLVEDPVIRVRGTQPAAHPDIALPAALFGVRRRNSAGLDLTDSAVVDTLTSAVSDQRNALLRAAPVIAGAVVEEGVPRAVLNPATRGEQVGVCLEGTSREADRAVAVASAAASRWAATAVTERARALDALGDAYEHHRASLIALLAREAGKTLPDALAEVREAVDFCRYYASEARRTFQPVALPGPTGEANQLTLAGRGVFVCISPWNFPLAIFTGQIAAALAAGNTVVAKPAEATPLIAFEALRLMHQVGIPENVVQLIPGAGAAGERLVANPSVAGVAFTGSTATARRINQTLAAREAPIAPLIAETGGQNVMLVDSTALVEQVVDDVVQSAFASAGQRCSALRVLYVQEDVAEVVIERLQGAMDELRVGDPTALSTDVGPIISADAAAALEAHVQTMAREHRLLHRTALPADLPAGNFVAPALLEIPGIDTLKSEHFGPVLHVVRFPAAGFDAALDAALSTGYGLTLGLHSRLENRAEQVRARATAGNVYVNRNMIGAVVGSQPFGGEGWSGTGPKAGGPYYLPRFATERVATTNTVATGGNTELLKL